MNSLLEWGIPIIEWFQNLGEGWLLPMQLFSFLGVEYFALLVMPALFWCFDAYLGIRIGLILLTSYSVNNVLKLAFGWPRPYWVSNQVTAYSTETSYGIPSGHAQNALVLWGRLGTALKHPIIRVISGLLILFISLSRLYLGVHFPIDVLAGWIVGGLILLLFIFLEKPVSKWLGMRSTQVKILIVICFSIGFLTIGLLTSAITSYKTVPIGWIEGAQLAAPNAKPINPRNIEGFFSSAGSLMGFGIGSVLLTEWGGFNAGGIFRKRILRYVVGVIGVVILYFGLQTIFPSGDSSLALIFRILRYAIVSFWVTYLGPKLFVALRLA